MYVYMYMYMYIFMYTYMFMFMYMYHCRTMLYDERAQRGTLYEAQAQ